MLGLVESWVAAEIVGCMIVFLGLGIAGERLAERRRKRKG